MLVYRLLRQIISYQGHKVFQVNNSCVKIEKDCILCGSTDFSPVLDENTNLIKCHSCGLVCVFLLPSEHQVISLYYGRELEIPSSANEKSNRRFLKLIEEFQSSGRIIDIGALYGDFLLVAKEKGWKVAGIELNKKAAKTVYYKYNIEMDGTVEEALSRYGEETFDIASMFHVLEHIVNPVEYISNNVSRLLKPNGLLVIRTPNINALLFFILGKHWGHLAFPAHLYFYSPSTLEILLEKCGFKILHIRTLSCPTVNEVFELIKGILELMGAKQLLAGIRRKSGTDTKQNKAAQQVGLMLKLKRLVNNATKPLFYATYPLWFLCEKTGRGSELFVITRKLK